MKEVKGQIVDIFKKKIFPGIVTIEDKKIKKITVVKNPDDDFSNRFIIPGFIDAHVHIESSMLTPIEFGKLIARNGCVAAICASKFERSGAVLSTEDIEELLKMEEVVALGEVMNFPGVISRDPELIAKINLSRKYKKVVDGHAPGLTGPGLDKYIEAGVQTDHECYRIEEAEEKISKDMHVQIREGSAAKNFDTLIPILTKYPDKVLFCTDDAHPDRLIAGKHINDLVERAFAKKQSLKLDIFTILQAACKNAIDLYGLPVGMTRVGDPADFVVSSSLDKLSTSVIETWVDGRKVYDAANPEIEAKVVGEDEKNVKPINLFRAGRIGKAAVRFGVPMKHFKEGMKVTVVGVLDGSLVTYREKAEMKIDLEEERGEEQEEEEEDEEKKKKYSANITSDVDRDILKTIVYCRYIEKEERPAIGFLRNFGLKCGAMASSVAHDSHNIIAIGTSDEEIIEAVNLVVQEKGGLVAVGKGKQIVLPLPVGGLMSLGGYRQVAEKYTELDRFVKEELGSGLSAPFMTLSFMALLVIPSVKISDRGLFDGEEFKFITWKDDDYQ